MGEKGRLKAKVKGKDKVKLKGKASALKAEAKGKDKAKLKGKASALKAKAKGKKTQKMGGHKGQEQKQGRIPTRRGPLPHWSWKTVQDCGQGGGKGVPSGHVPIRKKRHILGVEHEDNNEAWAPDSR